MIKCKVGVFVVAMCRESNVGSLFMCKGLERLFVMNLAANLGAIVKGMSAETFVIRSRAAAEVFLFH